MQLVRSTAILDAFTAPIGRLDYFRSLKRTGAVKPKKIHRKVMSVDKFFPTIPVGFTKCSARALCDRSTCIERAAFICEMIYIWKSQLANKSICHLCRTYLGIFMVCMWSAYKLEFVENLKASNGISLHNNNKFT